MIQIDMQMPEGCSGCRFETERGFCKAMPDNFCGYTTDEGRPEWCPLKEQEVKSPVEREKNGYWDYVCPTCGSRDEELFREWNYCPFCGQEVKWNANGKRTVSI